MGNGESNNVDQNAKPEDRNSTAYKDWVIKREMFYYVHPAPIRLFSLRGLINLGRCPRYPDDKKNIKYKNLTEKLRADNLIVFVSHLWLTREHPDDKNRKYSLIVKGLQETLVTFAPGFDQDSCYLWFDFGCINQNDCPTGELQELDRIIMSSDLLFTPHFDEEAVNDERRLPTEVTTLYHDYQHEKWNGSVKYSYLNRPWCRVEMMYGTHQPLFPLSLKKQRYFSAGFKALHELGRRPHILKVSEHSPMVLHPIVGALESEFNPLDVLSNLSDSTDEPKLKKLMDPVNLIKKKVLIGYEGEKNATGQPHGNGKQITPYGSIYEGEFKDGKRVGKGKTINTNGDAYEGDFEDDLFHGNGKYTFANGDVYEGELQQGKFHGKGKIIHKNGDIWEGDFQDDAPIKGKLTYLNGIIEEQEYRNNIRRYPQIIRN